MRWYEIIDRFFTPIMFASLAIGLFLPQFSSVFQPYVVPTLVLSLFLSVLKMDFEYVKQEINRLPFLLSIVLLFQILVPIFVYFIFSFFSRELAFAMLMVAAMPAGMFSPVLSDIAKGRTSLSLAMLVLTNLLCPFTIPLLAWFFGKTIVAVDPIAMNILLILLVILPSLAAILIRKFAKPAVEKTRNYYGAISTLLLAACIIGILSKSSGSFDVYSSIPLLLILYVLFIFFCAFGYFLPFNFSKEERISLGISKFWLNNALGMVAAASLLTPQITLIMVLSEIPLITLFSAFKWATGRSGTTEQNHKV